MTRRGNNEGTVHKRADGRWAAAVTLPEGGRRYFYGKTRREVATKLAQAQKSIADGLPLPSERLTVAAYLEQHWLPHVKSTIRANTYQGYESSLRIHVTPTLGKHLLARLAPQDLARLYAALLELGLAPRTVQLTHAVLHRALGQAERWNLVQRNVADLVDAPRPDRHEITPLAPAEIRALIDAARGERFEALYVLAVMTGMRQGELLGLRWADVDLEAGAVAVRQQVQRSPARRLQVTVTGEDGKKRREDFPLRRGQRRIAVGHAGEVVLDVSLESVAIGSLTPAEGWSTAVEDRDDEAEERQGVAVAFSSGSRRSTVTASIPKTEWRFTEPKTAKGRRSITIPGAAVEALRAHRVRQNEERLRLGRAWAELDLVFANEVGRPVERQNLVRRSFDPLLERAGLPRVRFHDLRHSAATLLLSEGVHPKVVQERLGHATIGITLDVYSHVLPSMQAEAASKLDGFLTRKAAQG